MNYSFRGTLDKYCPSWLKPRPGGKDRGYRYLYALAFLADVGIDFAIECKSARFPGIGTPTALPYISRDRQIRRGFAEPDDVFSLRVLSFRDDHRTQGNWLTLMRMVRAYLYPFKPRMRIVNNRGTWYTLNPDDTHQVVKDAGNWNWDGNTALRSRAWLIIYSDAGPWEEPGGWGDGDAPAWGGEPATTWGTTATPEQVASVQAIIDEWRSGTALYVNVIIAFDPASFDPAAAPGAPNTPDGNWGHWSKNVAGVQVPSRLQTARYWDGR